jgi:endoglucanase
MSKKFIIRFIAAILIVAGISIAAIAAFRSSDKADQNIVFADRTLLSGLWDNYKKIYWESGSGRTLDKQQNDITTSEGQSYTMMRAVWQGDQPTFDKSWEWTKEQLQREDNLFAWRWGLKPDGTYGILTDQGGQNTASDADSDIALALMMAASKWQSKTYLDDAKEIIPSIWDQEVITVKGKPYLASNNLEKDSQQDAIINPSYFSPYAYRLFAKVDKEHDWMALVDSSYELLDRSIESNLDKDSSVNLPPDWIAMNKQTGDIGAVEGSETLTTNYSFDALRTPWRLALDYKWYDESRAKDTLSKMSFLDKQWQEKGAIYSTYSHDGNTIKTDEVTEMYATALSYFAVVKPDVAKDVYDKKIKTLYDQNTNSWAREMTYYGDNWAWMGIALYDNKLDNLAENLN